MQAQQLTSAFRAAVSSEGPDSRPSDEFLQATKASAPILLYSARHSMKYASGGREGVLRGEGSVVPLRLVAEFVSWKGSHHAVGAAGGFLCPFVIPQIAFATITRRTLRVPGKTE